MNILTEGRHAIVLSNSGFGIERQNQVPINSIVIIHDVCYGGSQKISNKDTDYVKIKYDGEIYMFFNPQLKEMRINNDIGKDVIVPATITKVTKYDTAIYTAKIEDKIFLAHIRSTIDESKEIKRWSYVKSLKGRKIEAFVSGIREDGAIVINYNAYKREDLILLNNLLEEKDFVDKPCKIVGRTFGAFGQSVIFKPNHTKGFGVPLPINLFLGDDSASSKQS